MWIAAIAAGTSGDVLWLIFAALFDPYRFGKTLKGAENGRPRLAEG